MSDDSLIARATERDCGGSLKTCPFCGIKLEPCKTPVTKWHPERGLKTECEIVSAYKHAIRDVDCILSGIVVFDTHKNVEAWNKRYEGTCRWEYDEADGSWNTECGNKTCWEPFGHPPFCPDCGMAVDSL